MDTKSNYTPAQAREIGFDRNAYAPADIGIFTGTLVMKVYGDFCLRCYFNTDDGKKVKLTAWKNRRTGGYGPSQRNSAQGCNIDLKEIPLNTRLENCTRQSRTGKLSWVDAKVIT